MAADIARKPVCGPTAKRYGNKPEGVSPATDTGALARAGSVCDQAVDHRETSPGGLPDHRDTRELRRMSSRCALQDRRARWVMAHPVHYTVFPRVTKNQQATAAPQTPD